MNYFKDEILPDDNGAKKILSLNTLLSEVTPAAFSEDNIDPKDYVVYSERLQTRFLNIRLCQKPISKLISKKFISPKD